MQASERKLDSLTACDFGGEETPPALRFGDILRRPLPEMRGKPLARWICRLTLAALGKRVLHVKGWEAVEAAADPFIVAFNHTTRTEALVVPALLAWHRHGRMVHFFADWNFLMWPVIGVMISQGESIIVGRKPAKPAFLNHLRPWLVPATPAMRRARALLERGCSVGIFPEGTVNRDPHRMLAGDFGAARLSLETGVSVVPAGIRFPRYSGNGPVPDQAEMTIEFGAALKPTRTVTGRARPEDARDWHAIIMRAISELSGKSWNQETSKRSFRKLYEPTPSNSCLAGHQ